MADPLLRRQQRFRKTRRLSTVFPSLAIQVDATPAWRHDAAFASGNWRWLADVTPLAAPCRGCRIESVEINP
jgi:hypothetical protein